MTALAVVLVAVLFSAVCLDIVYVARLPHELAASAFGDVRIGAACGHSDNGKLIFKLFGLFPIKTIDVRTTDDVYIGGTPVGLSLRSDGVIVEEIGTVATSAGEVAARTNVVRGDIIVEADGREICDVVSLAKVVRAADGPRELPLTVLRGGGRIKASVTPMYEHLSGQLRLGLWLKDKVNGIGTMSFVKKDGAFGALGHAITAGETIVPISGGELKACKILGFTKGRRGAPGEIKGLIRNETKGSLKANTAYGVFGDLYDDPAGELYPVGSRLDVATGAAKMYTTVDEKTDFYDIEIIRALPQSKRSDKSMVIRVTDKRLLEKTGGIIQGMSGSPIVQNGKLVGAVTHVFINDPTKGYGIYLDWMY